MSRWPKTAEIEVTVTAIVDVPLAAPGSPAEIAAAKREAIRQARSGFGAVIWIDEMAQLTGIEVDDAA